VDYGSVPPPLTLARQRPAPRTRVRRERGRHAAGAQTTQTPRAASRPSTAWSSPIRTVSVPR
jgi:hypothetical protein